MLSAKEAAAVGVKRKAPPQIRLEQIREIGQFLSRSPKEASRSVVVLEQAETITSSAANGLLKTLEEPGRATLILIAPTIESLLPTLVSRCQRIPFYSLNPSEMAQILVKTGHDLILERPALLLMAQGSPGMAIARRQQLSRIPPDLLNGLLALPKSLGDALELARQIDKTLDTEAQLWLMDYLQHSYWQSFLSPNIVQRLDLAKRTLLMKVQPRLVWEVTLLELGYGG